LIFTTEAQRPQRKTLSIAFLIWRIEDSVHFAEEVPPDQNFRPFRGTVFYPIGTSRSDKK